MIYICVYDIHMCVYMIYIYIWIKSHHLPILTGIDHPKKTHIKINIAQALHAQRWRNHKGSWTGLHSVGFASAMAELSENVMCIYIYISYILSTVYNIGIHSLGREGGREGRTDGGTEGRRDGGTDGRTDGGTEGGRGREREGEGGEREVRW